MIESFTKLFAKHTQNINDNAVRQKYGTFCGVFGIVCNFILFFLKLLSGFAVSSVSIIADAVHDLSDMISSVITIFAFKMATRPADRQHPFGHGRIEYVAGLFVSFLIVFMGLEFVKWSFEKILNPKPVEFAGVTILILILSILLKFCMVCVFYKIGNKIRSSAIKANFKESLGDMVATLTVLTAILITKTFGILLDGWIGLAVSLFIIYTGFSMAKETLGPILGQAPDVKFVNNIKAKILSYKDISGIHDLIVHSYGPGKTLVSLHAEVKCDANLADIHDTIDTVERAIKNEFSCEIVIHIDPIVTYDENVQTVRKQIEQISKSVDERISVHDFRIVAGKNWSKHNSIDQTGTGLKQKNEQQLVSNLVFDIVLPDQTNLNEHEVVSKIKSGIKAFNNTYDAVINVDREYVV